MANSMTYHKLRYILPPYYGKLNLRSVVQKILGLHLNRLQDIFYMRACPQLVVEDGVYPKGCSKPFADA